MSTTTSSAIAEVQVNISRTLRHEGLREEPPAQHEDLAAALSGIFWPYRWLVLALCIAGLVLGSLTALMMSPRYTATALILPSFRGIEKSAQDASMPAVDAATLLEGKVRLLERQPISRSIAEQLASTESATGLPVSTHITNFFRTQFGMKPVTRADIIAADLTDRRKFAYERRTYLIELSMTAASPNAAAAYANAVASQFVHDEQQKKLVDTYAQALKTANQLSVTFGDKHPTLMRARKELEDTQTLITTGKTYAELLSESELDATGLVTAAHGNTAVQASRKPIILAGVLFGLLGAIALVVFIELDTTRQAVSQWFARYRSQRLT